jgi:predicted kinase
VGVAKLIALAGLPGSGKSSIARELARQSGALWLRIDSIEQAILDSDIATGSVGDAGYRAAYAVAEDNLRLGRDVIGDSVNGWPETRDAWRDVAVRAGANIIEVEIVCSDPEEHRRRVKTRKGDVPGLILPDWQAVIRRDYKPWSRQRLTIDTAGRSIEACVREVRAATVAVA